MKAWIIEKELRGIREVDGYVKHLQTSDTKLFVTESCYYEHFFETKEEARNEAIKIKLALIFELQDEIKRLERLVF
jgi:hypothetical protein